MRGPHSAIFGVHGIHLLGLGFGELWEILGRAPPTQGTACLALGCSAAQALSRLVPPTPYFCFGGWSTEKAILVHMTCFGIQTKPAVLIFIFLPNEEGETTKKRITLLFCQVELFFKFGLEK